MLTPIISAATKSSRMAMAARPWREWTKFQATQMTRAAITMRTGSVVWLAMPGRPRAPWVMARFSRSTRIASPKPRVAMAK